MAIKIAGTTVINNSLGVINMSNIEGNYSNFHGIVTSIANDLDMSKPVMSRTLTADTTFTASNLATGKVCLLMLDIGSSQYIPTWPASIKWPGDGTEPDWDATGVTKWLVCFTCWDNTTIRATATGWGGTSAASFSNFTLTGAGGWDTEKNSYGTGTPWAAASIAFLHDAANNRVNITHTAGDSRNGSTQATVYANYTGLTGITSVEVQYNLGSQQCYGDNCGANSGQSYGPLPTDDSISLSTYYSYNSSQVFFGWSAEVDSSSGTYSHTTANFNSLSNTDPHFRIKIVCTQGTFYSTAQTNDVSLYCNFGPNPQIGGGN